MVLLLFIFIAFFLMSNVSFYSSTTKCTNIGPVLLPIVLPSNVSIYGNTTECTSFGGVLELLLVHTHFLHHYCTYSVCSAYAAFITVNTFSITEQILSIVAGSSESRTPRSRCPVLRSQDRHQKPASSAIHAFSLWVGSRSLVIHCRRSARIPAR